MTGSLQIKKDHYYMVLNFKDKTGKRRLKWLATHISAGSARDRRKAEKMLSETLREFEDLEYIEPTNMLFSDYLDEWLKLHRVRIQLSTYDGYRYMLDKYIAPYFSERKITLFKLKPVDIERYYAHCMIDLGLSPNTVLKHHQLIHKGLQHALVNKYVTENVANYVPKPKKVFHEKSIMEPDELKRLLDAIKSEKISIAVVLAIFYGLRRSEVLGLRWSDVDLEHRILRIRQKVIRTKDENGKLTFRISSDLKTQASYRDFPISDKTEQYLLAQREWIEENKSFFGDAYCMDYNNYICVDEHGKLLNPDYVSKRFEQIAKELGFEKVSFHSLRHSCCTLMAIAGFDVKQAQKWMGHSNYQTTADYYTHTYRDSKQNIINTLSDIL